MYLLKWVGMKTNKPERAASQIAGGALRRTFPAGRSSVTRVTLPELAEAVVSVPARCVETGQRRALDRPHPQSRQGPLMACFAGGVADAGTNAAETTSRPSLASVLSFDLSCGWGAVAMTARMP